MSGETIYSSNLTLHDGTGIGSWTREEFVRAVREGFRPDDSPLLYPTLPLPELTEAEVGAIYAYLRIVPPIERAVDRADRPALAETLDGEELYRYYGCRSCHGDNGVGIADLRRANTSYPADEDLRRWIEDPSATKPGTKMPTWRDVIAEEHYAPLMAYVRTLGARN